MYFINLFIHPFVRSFISLFPALVFIIVLFHFFCRFLVEFNLYSWWHSDLTIKGLYVFEDVCDVLMASDLKAHYMHITCK